MSVLSDVTCTLAQRAADIEHARLIFTSEIRAFTASVLEGVRRATTQPWMTGRIRLDLPREIATELKTGYFSSQFALAQVTVRFRKGAKYVAIAELPFGIGYDATEGTDAFIWSVRMIPYPRYLRLDDFVWDHWKRTRAGEPPPGAEHFARVNVIRFVARAVDSQLSSEHVLEDVKKTLEYLLTADEPIGRAVGFDAAPGEDEG